MPVRNSIMPLSISSTPVTILIIALIASVIIATISSKAGPIKSITNPITFFIKSYNYVIKPVADSKNGVKYKSVQSLISVLCSSK